MAWFHALLSRGIAAYSPQTVAKIESLFPSRPIDELALTQAPISDEIVVATDTVKNVILSFSTGVAYGPSGLRADHIKTAIMETRDKVGEQLLTTLAELVQMFAAGRLSPTLQPALCGGRLIPLVKKDSGVRPIVIGECRQSTAQGHRHRRVRTVAPTATGSGSCYQRDSHCHFHRMVDDAR